jgi:tetratricopeptide (TPR) repeat protein
VASTEQALGHWEAALSHLQEARRLDPRSVLTLRRFGSTALWLRRTGDARQAFDVAVALAPTNPTLREFQSMTYLQEGDLAGARTVLKAALREVESAALVAHVASFWDLAWVLEEPQRELLLRLTPSAFDEDRGVWSISLTQGYAITNDETNVRKHAEITRAALLNNSPRSRG